MRVLKNSTAHGNNGERPKVERRVFSTEPLFLRIHKSGTSCGIYLPVTVRVAMGVRAGDALRATLLVDGESRKLVLEHAR